MVYHLCVL